MKKVTLVLVVLFLVGILAGCGQTGEKWEALTEEELSYFNGTGFFNHYENRSNQFLSSLYDSPEQIDLYELLYCDTGDVEEKTDKEIFTAYAVLVGTEYTEDVDIPCACDKMTTESIDQFLQKYTGLTLAETERIGLNKDYIYLEEYDAYYHFHGDTNFWTQVMFERGERQGELIRLYYEDTFRNEGNKVVTLRQVENGYQFVSNQMAE